MNIATRVGIFVGTAALVAAPLGTAQAVEIPSDLQFSYTMSQPLIGQIKENSNTQCYQSLGESFTLSMQAGPASGLNEAINKQGNEILCTIVLERILSNVVITGTAEASAQGQSGKGAFTLTCEVGQRSSSFFSIVVSAMGLDFGPNPYGMEGNGYVSCNWSIAVDDAQKSQLAGTLELQGAYTKDSERVSCEEAGITISGPPGGPETYCVAYDLNVKAYLTGATGAYAGRTGEGSLTQRGYAAVTVPLQINNDTTCPPEVPNCADLMNPSLEGCQYSASDPNQGGWVQWPALPPGAPTPPGYQGPGWYLCGGSTGGGGDAGGTPEESPYDPSIPPCVPDESGAMVPPDGFTNCVNPGSQTASLVSALGASVRAATGQQLSLSTKKTSGTTRFVSPAQTTSDVVRPFGASRTSVPSIRIATVPGATCAVNASAGAVKAVVTARGTAVGGLLDTKVNAASLRSKLKAEVGAQAVITATCSTKVGKKTVKLPAASITVKFT